METLAVAVSAVHNPNTLQQHSIAQHNAVMITGGYRHAMAPSSHAAVDARKLTHDENLYSLYTTTQMEAMVQCTSIWGQQGLCHTTCVRASL